MPELHAKKHDHALTALLRLDRESLSLPILGGYFLQEDDSFLLLEIGDKLELQASTGLTLAYKLVAESHDYTLTALTKFPASPVFVVEEGNMLMEDSDALLTELSENIIYTDIRGN